MKSLILIMSVLTVMSVQAKDVKNCELTLGIKKENAKNAKLGGVSFSAKQLEALREVCNLNLELMSDAELIEDFKASLAKKRAREVSK